MKEHTVSQPDQAVIAPLRKAVQLNQQALGSYLANIAVERWGFKPDELLTFDLTEIEHNKVKVMKTDGDKPKARKTDKSNA